MEESDKIIIRRINISNFRCFDSEGKTIEFEDTITTFIGANGVGKSTVFNALLKVLSNNPKDRGFEKRDFNDDTKEIVIDLLIEIKDPEQLEDDRLVYYHEKLCYIHVDVIVFPTKPEGRFNQEPTVYFNYYSGHDKKQKIDISIEGKLFDASNKNMEQARIEWQPDYTGVNLRKIIEIYYIPSRRDSEADIQLLEGELNAKITEYITKGTASSDESIRKNVLRILSLLDRKVNRISSVKDLKAEVEMNWKKNFPKENVSYSIYLDDLERVLHFMDWFFGKWKLNHISDGQKSIAYISIFMSLIKLQSKPYNFGRILIVEEPESYLSPQKIGGLIAAIRSFAEENNTQVFLSTHSTVILKRTDPYSIRFFKSNQEIRKLNKENLDEEDYKYIKNAVYKNPELYFANLVVLVEGDSEEDILPLILEKVDIDPDLHGISITTLGGRHVNHMWRLMKELDMNYVTLLDLDLGKQHGGMKNIERIISELKKYTDYDSFPDTDPSRDIIDVAKKLRKYGVYFSSPLDFDFAMLESFETEYRKGGRV
ncbi:AAA family ATPase [Bacillus cereus group sp. BfR-BA-01441]|uniref:ATP-dependent nuclease n=1 Tax=Bacillus cereus group sp. BfR-BA-01441 TaxID=2920348 RepID=UPI001F581334